MVNLKQDTASEEQEPWNIIHDNIDTEHIHQELPRKSFWFDNTTFANLSAGLLLFYIALLSNFTGNIAPKPSQPGLKIIDWRGNL